MTVNDDARGGAQQRRASLDFYLDLPESTPSQQQWRAKECLTKHPPCEVGAATATRWQRGRRRRPTRREELASSKRTPCRRSSARDDADATQTLRGSEKRRRLTTTRRVDDYFEDVVQRQRAAAHFSSSHDGGCWWRRGRCARKEATMQMQLRQRHTKACSRGAGRSLCSDVTRRYGDAKGCSYSYCIVYLFTGMRRTSTKGGKNNMVLVR